MPNDSRSPESRLPMADSVQGTGMAVSVKAGFVSPVGEPGEHGGSGARNVAGRELDALVAEEVMGWERWNGPDHLGHTVWATGDEETPTHTFFEPSSNIAAAWQVVERMKELGWSFRYGNNSCSKDQHGAAFAWGYRGLGWNILTGEYIEEDDAVCVNDTAPLAICLAALKAVTERNAPPPRIGGEAANRLPAKIAGLAVELPLLTSAGSGEMQTWLRKWFTKDGEVREVVTEEREPCPWCGERLECTPMCRSRFENGERGGE